MLPIMVPGACFMVALDFGPFKREVGITHKEGIMSRNILLQKQHVRV